jgi:CHAT domain-containing protein
VVPARRTPIKEALKRGEFDVFHLACHGARGNPNGPEGFAIRLEDGLFFTLELSDDLEERLRRDAPLIFLNACHGGRSGVSLTRLGGWGARYVQLGCGAFVGALWSVCEASAPAFARAFYEALILGHPVGEAMRFARRQVRNDYPNDPTWLSYCCFADPLARLPGRAQDPA